MASVNDIMINGQQMKKLYEKMGLELCESYHLARIELDILLFLANNPAYDTARDIVEMRLIAKSHVSKSMENLIQAGLVSRQPDPRDRRCVHLKLEAEAEKIVKEARKMQKQFFELLFDGFTEEEKHILAGYIQKMSDNIKKCV